ncbi:YheC/YheD family protein [Tumebacillus permanentifrigoris]|uniref:YheC/D-like protein n=1 Tax=Tumebacillus permanentifrigoris TaxID=378543 RepID=A0A316DEB2_9BACL|nr:YheC/YheD family protein [Tumebacillus permanentifrigoris]PWK15519.1 YheC/D-like protein [Tumebacillus permanentifrigoris]
MIRRRNLIYLGVRESGNWYLSISDEARRQVQLPSHRHLRVRTHPHADPIILPVVSNPRHATTERDVLIPVGVQKNKQGILLGPIIGILTVRRIGTNTFRGNRDNFRDICEMGRRLGLTVVVFTPEGVNGSHRIVGYLDKKYSSGKRVWKRVTLPFPSVVYNRIPDREAEAKPAIESLKKQFAELGIPMFNHNFFNKLQLHEWMQKSPSTKGYLPKTEPLTDTRQILRWMEQHDLLYVKPVDGKAGDGILQVRREGKGWLLVAQQYGNRTRMRFATRGETAQAVWKRVKGRPYLLQQGIELASFNGRLFDLRMLVQKNRYGRWKVTGIGARVADVDGITTHVPNGGEIASASPALRGAFGTTRGASILKRAQEAALLLAQTLERSVRSEGGLLGELSLDVGVDREGNLWFFEANAKPMKFDEPRIRARSLMRLLQYCEYLASTQ